MHDESSVADYFDRCARTGAMASFEPADEEKLARFASAWDIRPGERVLEPGCGQGRLTERLARAVGETGEVLAFDLSPEMIAAAGRRALPPNARFVRARATAVPAEDGSFDKVIAFHVLPHLGEKPRALAEFARVLKPGGDLWVNHLKGRDELNEFHRTVAPEVSGHEIPPEEDMRSMLEQAGFELISLSDSSGGYALHAVKAD